MLQCTKKNAQRISPQNRRVLRQRSSIIHGRPNVSGPWMSSASQVDPLHWIAVVVKHAPDRLLLQTLEGQHFSYRQFDELADRLATALTDHGVESGDRVAAQVEKSPHAIALYLACLKIGAIFVPLNTAYTLA